MSRLTGGAGEPAEEMSGEIEVNLWSSRAEQFVRTIKESCLDRRILSVKGLGGRPSMNSPLATIGKETARVWETDSSFPAVKETGTGEPSGLNPLSEARAR